MIKLILEQWFISIDDKSFKEFNQIRIPTKSSVSWKLKDHDFKWLALEITNKNYNFKAEGDFLTKNTSKQEFLKNIVNKEKEYVRKQNT